MNETESSHNSKTLNKNPDRSNLIVSIDTHLCPKAAVIMSDVHMHAQKFELFLTNLCVMSLFDFQYKSCTEYC